LQQVLRVELAQRGKQIETFVFESGRESGYIVEKLLGQGD
jgi:hypothetical protein